MKKKIILAAAAAALCLAVLAGLASFSGSASMQALCTKDISFAELTENGETTLLQRPEELARLRLALKGLRAVPGGAEPPAAQGGGSTRLILHTSDGARTVVLLAYNPD